MQHNANSWSFVSTCIIKVQSSHRIWAKHQEVDNYRLEGISKSYRKWIGSLSGRVCLDVCAAAEQSSQSVNLSSLVVLHSLVRVRFNKQTGIRRKRGNGTGLIFCLHGQSVSLKFAKFGIFNIGSIKSQFNGSFAISVRSSLIFVLQRLKSIQLSEILYVNAFRRPFYRQLIVLLGQSVCAFQDRMCVWGYL